VAAGLLGVVATIGWFIARGRDRRAGQSWRLNTHELFDPLGAVGLLALVAVGVALMVGPPPTALGLRAAASAMCGALALAFIVSAIGLTGRGGRVG
jgi:cytochrome c oxidase assembly factor CtaG